MSEIVDFSEIDIAVGDESDSVETADIWWIMPVDMEPDGEARR